VIQAREFTRTPQAVEKDADGPIGGPEPGSKRPKRLSVPKRGSEKGTSQRLTDY
jgi:hypothetical protein